MAQNSEFSAVEGETTDLGQIPLLPRFAWNSRLAYLKTLLKVKQALDREESASIRF
ncbi:MAG: hypothetical protein QNJ36_00500 [Calothrix sp. MO_167.B42]|nr:hypothetical protein [Calothrix sp. MO_167.B42]